MVVWLCAVVVYGVVFGGVVLLVEVWYYWWWWCCWCGVNLSTLDQIKLCGCVAVWSCRVVRYGCVVVWLLGCVVVVVWCCIWWCGIVGGGVVLLVAVVLLVWCAFTTSDQITPSSHITWHYMALYHTAYIS